MTPDKEGRRETLVSRSPTTGSDFAGTLEDCFRREMADIVDGLADRLDDALQPGFAVVARATIEGRTVAAGLSITVRIEPLTPEHLAEMEAPASGQDGGR